MFNKFKIIEFHSYIWNHYEKCIRSKYTKTTSIGFVMLEIGFEIWEFGKKEKVLSVKLNHLISDYIVHILFLNGSD